MSDNRQTEVTSPSPSPQCWGYESPSQLNREVSSILSRGPPPAEDERHKWTHPSPVHTSARPVSCPLSAAGAGAGVRDKKFSSPLAVSAFQLTDQSQELRNHLYQAAYQHHSPFRFPFLPVNRYLPSLPPSPVRLPYPFPYPSYPPYPLPPDLRDSGTHRDCEPPVSNKRKYNEESGNTKARGTEWRDKPEQPPPSQTAGNSGLRTTAGNQPAPPHFRAGSMIQLASGNMKRVELLRTEDFVNSAASCPDISLEEATVTKLDNNNNNSVLLTFSVGKSVCETVTFTISPEHPFFVTGRGWSSCSPDLTMTRFSLDCKQLAVGDVCISLRHGVSEAGDKMSHKQVRFQDSTLPPHQPQQQPVKRKRLSPPNPGMSSPFNINVKVTQVQVPVEERTFLSEKRKPLQHQKEAKQESV